MQKMMLMKIVLISTLMMLLSGGVQQEPQTTRRTIAGTRVSLEPPAQFNPAPEFSGYTAATLDSTIHVLEMSGPVSEVTKELWDPAALLKRGMVLLNKEDVALNGRSAVLALVEQKIDGVDYLKWLTAFGDEKTTAVVVATFPKKSKDQLSAKMKATVLTARIDSGSTVMLTEGLSFTVSEKGELKLASRMINSLLFTRNGVRESKNLADPIFVVAPALREVDIANPEEFAKARVLKTATATNIVIEKTTKVTIAGLSGYEILAKGTDSTSSEPMLIQQTMLFEDKQYFILSGLVSWKEKEKYLPVFREMASSFKLVR